jgi:hypothetical protein
MILNVFSKILEKSAKFKEIYKGESCYIFSNTSLELSSEFFYRAK